MKSCLLIIAYMGITCLSVNSLRAQSAPGWSRGQQTFSFSYEDGIRRAPLALQAEGYRIDYSGGAFSVGIKGVHTAIIMCTPSSDGKLTVNIVVASNGEGGGAERVRLQARMDNPGAVGPPTGSGAGSGAFSGTWSGNDWGALTIQQNGNQVTGGYSSPGGTMWGRVEGNRILFSWKNTANGIEGDAYFDLKPGGKMEGKWCNGRGCNLNTGTNSYVTR